MRHKINLLVVLFLLFTSGMFAQTFTVSPGGDFFSPKKAVFHFGVETMEKVVTFDSSCIYSFGDAEDGDINKLIGWGVGLTNKHSIRIGWNCKSGHAIDLYAYLHYNGSRYLIKKDSSSNKKRADLIGTGFYTNAELNCRIHRARDAITFDVTQGPRIEKLIIKFANFPDGLGWYQFPYFGGSYKAPHKMKIIIK